MISFIVRRLLTALPALVAFAIILFGVIASAPPPPGLTDDELARRFLDLPVLFNFDPQDRPRMIDTAVARLPGLDLGAREREILRLTQIGAAGLADLVPAMAKVTATDRAKIARDLAPLAFRMGLEDVADLDTPAKAENYWQRTLEEHAPDLRAPSVRRALLRHLAEPNEPLYIREIRSADTAALSPLIATLDSPLRASERNEVELLAVAAANRAGAKNVSDEKSLRAWWTVHRAEYVEFDPLERIAGRLTETRFGRWVFHAVTHRLGQSWRDGSPVLDDILRRLPQTLVRIAIALLLAYAIALPLGIFTAARRNGPADRASAPLLLLFYATPAFVLAMIFRAVTPHGGARGSGGGVPIVLALALTTAAPIARQARAKLLDFLRQDYVRAARARGINGIRLWTGHIFRNAFSPLLSTLVTVIPVTFSAALVLEEILDVDGLGRSAVAAIRSHDVPWLMGLALLMAAATMMTIVIIDLVMGSVDPRIRKSLETTADEGD